MNPDRTIPHEWLHKRSRFFPPPELWPPVGPILMTDTLPLEMVVDAYAHGLFPWPFGRRARWIPWASPNPRSILEWNQFHVPRSLARTLRRGIFEIRCNTAFTDVMNACAMEHRGDDGKLGGDNDSWITPKMIRTYTRLHEIGLAHSIESWRDGRLVGGVYGVAIRRLFAAESMFYREPDASKVALVTLVEHLRARGFQLFDIQEITPNTRRFGAMEIPRSEYLRRLRLAVFG
jgi:leucyl/phenylalanyl-tRNA--protein transferase